jgi:hypothetical protein
LKPVEEGPRLVSATSGQYCKKVSTGEDLVFKVPRVRLGDSAVSQPQGDLYALGRRSRQDGRQRVAGGHRPDRQDRARH